MRFKDSDIVKVVGYNYKAIKKYNSKYCYDDFLYDLNYFTNICPIGTIVELKHYYIWDTCLLATNGYYINAEYFKIVPTNKREIIISFIWGGGL